MSRIKTTLLAGAAVLALPGVAAAQGFMDGFRVSQQQAVTGLYIGAGAGVNFHNNVRVSPDRTLAAGLGAAGVTGRGTAVFEPGFVGVGAIGWGLGNGLRLEIEGNYRENDIQKVRGFPGANLAGRASGLQRTYGVMGNVYYDFLIPGVPAVIPYIGGGIGYAWREWDQVSVHNVPGTAALRSRATEGGLAWQGIVGAAFPITALPGLSITAEYRYFGMEPQRFNTRAVTTPGNLGIAGGTLKAESHNHSVLLGVRYAFNQPRPAPVAAVAPAPAPAPAPARTYLVFFDWDRADLTDRARQIISDAAQNSRRTQSTRIEVSGHADRSGTPQYNQRLSERRAEAVAAELVRNGVSRSEIGVQAFGESRPLVPTGDGVREPQNRRVEIVLR
ncbi:OmpA family protein [Sabulicella glaciei]|uniref:OmpA family protein n=1 Tax=Sabulicella glaciei TaxID=2984948 RepID=A0ABT3NU05_9PROT|nr:OmpA family protein [Roseococcus sp. MDT2-1-1]MCW8085647.1 OmpA family protein [Roseococcus sp. MDT2-1-1]